MSNRPFPDAPDQFPNPLAGVLWQYDQAGNILSLLNSKAQWYQDNHYQFLIDWFVNVFNLDTANEFGLSVWSIILELPLFTVSQPSPSSYPAFGFNPHGMNFGNGNFATDAPTVNNLSVDQKRLILKLRYFQLVTRGAVPEINRFLATLFGPGKVFVLDNLNMTITYIFTEAPDSGLIYVLQQFDILPRPAGVGVNIIVSATEGFGFDPYGLNYDNGNFYGASL